MLIALSLTTKQSRNIYESSVGIRTIDESSPRTYLSTSAVRQISGKGTLSPLFMMARIRDTYTIQMHLKTEWTPQSLLLWGPLHHNLCQLFKGSLPFNLT